MKKVVSPVLGTFLLTAFAASSFATPFPSNATMLQHWEFNEVEGTGLPDVANSVSGGAGFNWDIHDTRTSGNSTLIVNRTDASQQISFAEMNNLPSSGTIWLVHDIVSWDYGTSEIPRFRVGFFDNLDTAIDDETEEPLQSANHVGALTVGADHRPDSGVGGFATGDGSSIGYTDLGFGAASSSETAPIRIVTEYNLDANEYEVFYSLDFMDENPNYTSIGSAVTDSSRGPNFLGISTINNFPEEGLEMDQMFVAVPEPSTYALIVGLGFGAFVLWRRRRGKN